MGMAEKALAQGGMLINLEWRWGKFWVWFGRGLGILLEFLGTSLAWSLGGPG
jgi:hypothetical protein